MRLNSVMLLHIKGQFVMSGNNRYLLDSNALIFILGQGIVIPDVALFYSSISKIELLSCPKLEVEDERNIRSALTLMKEITLNEEVIEKTISIRKAGSLKLPIV